MEFARDSSIAEIKPIPGLYISDRFATRNRPLLKSLNIKYILSATHQEDIAKFNDNGDTKIIRKHIDIDDDATEDILCHLKEACDWIDAALKNRSGESNVGVLVHCTQGISRSAAFIVGYLMRTLSVPYSTALSMVRETRTWATPNRGFEYQLKVWEHCQYDVYLPDSPSTASESISNEGPKEKPAYKAWKRERDALLSKGEEVVNRARVSSIASLAAEFGRKRKESIEAAGAVKNESEIERSNDIEERERKRQEDWQRVEQMEKDWNERLISGEYASTEIKK
ncbi:protein-tyrosine phosphatase-like protein [Xylogone sp. PMI_703]|nr:protein-tyrosine phosphatase-like protein [Xylogone sp. PMI_703]